MNSFLDEMKKYISERDKPRSDIFNLKKILSSDEAYKILDSSEKDLTSWCAGGCAILAFALNKIYNYPVYVIYNTDTDKVEHFIVKNDKGRFVDCDGEHINMLKDFKKREIVKGGLQIIKYVTGMDIGDIVIDEKTINTLVKYLKSKLD